MPITRLNTFEAKAGQGAELREFLVSVIDLIIGAPGCLSVELLAGHDNPERLAIVEAWDSVESHRAAASRIPPELMQRAMALFALPPAGAYYDSVTLKTAAPMKK